MVRCALLRTTLMLGCALVLTSCGGEGADQDVMAVNMATGEQARFDREAVPPGWAICAAVERDDPCGFVMPPAPLAEEQCGAVADPAACLAPKCALVELCIELLITVNGTPGDVFPRCFDVCVALPKAESEACEEITNPRRCQARGDCHWQGPFLPTHANRPDCTGNFAPHRMIPPRWPWRVEGHCLSGPPMSEPPYPTPPCPQPPIPEPPYPTICSSHRDCARDEVCDLLSCDDGALGECVARPEGCYQLYAPVCGCDGETYGNDCDRLAVGACLRHHGACGCAGVAGAETVTSL